MKPAAIWLAALLSLAVATTAPAASFRVPATGDPALTIQAPPGWRSTVDAAGDLTLVSPDRTGVLTLVVTSDPLSVIMSPTEAAAAFARGARKPPYASSAPGSVAGLAGTAFTGSWTTQDGRVFAAWLMIAKPDPKHMIMLSTLKQRGLTADQAGALDAVRDSVALVGPPPAPVPPTPPPVVAATPTAKPTPTAAPGHTAADAAGL